MFRPPLATPRSSINIFRRVGEIFRLDRFTPTGSAVTVVDFFWLFLAIE
jgi:hypothetical protein